MSGAQFKDEDDDEQPGANDKGQAQKNEQEPSPAPAGSGNGGAQKFTNAFQEWVGQERERRQKRALEITDEAIRKFRPNTEDPERFLSAAVMWYNRFLLVAPDVAERKTSAETRKKFEEIGRPALDKMKYYLEKAEACQHELEQKGLWQVLPERRVEYLQVLQLLKGSVFALSGTLENNRTQMNQDQVGSTNGNTPAVH